MYYAELANHIELLKHLVTYIQKTYTFLALILRFTLIDSYCNKVSLCVLNIFLRGPVVSFFMFLE